MCILVCTAPLPTHIFGESDANSINAAFYVKQLESWNPYIRQLEDGWRCVQTLATVN